MQPPLQAAGFGAGAALADAARGLGAVLRFSFSSGTFFLLFFAEGAACNHQLPLYRECHPSHLPFINVNCF